MRTLRTPIHLALISVLRQERSSKGMTQAVLAARMSRPQSFVAKVEVGERRLDVMEFVEYAKAMGLTPAELLEKTIAATDGAA